MAQGSGGAHLFETDAEKLVREQAEEKARENRYRKLQLRFNGILMGASVLTFAVLLYQNHVLRGTLDEMARQRVIMDGALKETQAQTKSIVDQTSSMAQQTALMNRQASISEQQAELAHIANETNYAVQRASLQWVDIDLIHGPDRDGGYGFEVYAIWENSGVTNAVDVISHIHLDHLPDGPTADRFTGGRHVTRASVSATIVGPRGRFNSAHYARPESFFLGRSLTRDGKPISNMYFSVRERNIFLYGWVAYRDTFPDTKPHVTGFCRQLASIEFSSGQSQQLQHTWGTCKDYKYSCIDERCPDYASIIGLLPQ